LRQLTLQNKAKHCNYHLSRLAVPNPCRLISASSIQLIWTRGKGNRTHSLFIQQKPKPIWSTPITETHTSKHVIKYQHFTKRTLTQAQFTLQPIYAATQPPFKTQLEL